MAWQSCSGAGAEAPRNALGFQSAPKKRGGMADYALF